MNSKDYCPCGTSLEYIQCCGPFHSGEKFPPTAEALMRSRFSAYAMDNMAYIQQTWDSSTRPAEDKLNFGGEKINWQKLEIIGSKKGGQHDGKGIVEFKAYYKKNNADYLLHEISRFVKNNNRWYYVDGVVKAAAPVVKQSNEGRNAPCPCGSGKKYKRCCGAG